MTHRPGVTRKRRQFRESPVAAFRTIHLRTNLGTGFRRFVPVFRFRIFLTLDHLTHTDSFLFLRWGFWSFCLRLRRTLRRTWSDLRSWTLYRGCRWSGSSLWRSRTRGNLRCGFLNEPRRSGLRNWLFRRRFGRRWRFNRRGRGCWLLRQLNRGLDRRLSRRCGRCCWRRLRSFRRFRNRSLIHALIHRLVHALIHRLIHALIHRLIHALIHRLIHALIHRLIHALIHWLAHALIHWLVHALIHRLVHALIHRLVLTETGILLETTVHALIHRGVHTGLLIKAGALAETTVHSLVHSSVHPLIHAGLLKTTLLRTTRGLRLTESGTLLETGIHSLIHTGLLAKSPLLRTKTAGHCAAHPIHISRNRTAGDPAAKIGLNWTLETTHSALLLETAGLLAETAIHSTLLTKTAGLLCVVPPIGLAETALRRTEAALRLESTGLLRPKTTLLAHSGIHAVTTADPIIAQRAKESNPL